MNIGELVIMPEANINTANVGSLTRRDGLAFADVEDVITTIGTADNMFYMSSSRESIGPVEEGRVAWPMNMGGERLYFFAQGAYSLADIDVGGALINEFNVGEYLVTPNGSGSNTFVPTPDTVASVDISYVGSLVQTSDWIDTVSFTAAAVNTEAVKWYVNGIRQSVTGPTFNFTPPGHGLFEVRANAFGTLSEPQTVNVTRVWVMRDYHNTGNITPREDLTPLGQILGQTVPVGGMYIIDTPGVTIEGFIVEDRRVSVRAANVTLRDFVVDGGFQVAYGVSLGAAINATAEDGRIFHTTGDGVISGNGSQLRRLDISHVAADAVKAEFNVLLEDSWIHFLGFMSPRSHADGIQTSGGAAGSRNIIVRNNRFDTPYIQPYHQTTANIIIGADLGNIRDVMVRDNVLSGGSFTIYIGGGLHRLSRNGAVFGNTFATNWNIGPIDTRGVSWTGVMIEDNHFTELLKVGSVFVQDEGGNRIEEFAPGQDITLVANVANYNTATARTGELIAFVYRDGMREAELGREPFEVARYVPMYQFNGPVGHGDFAHTEITELTHPGSNRMRINQNTRIHEGFDNDRDFFLQWAGTDRNGNPRQLPAILSTASGVQYSAHASGGAWLRPESALPEFPTNELQTIDVTVPADFSDAEIRVFVTDTGATTTQADGRIVRASNVTPTTATITFNRANHFGPVTLQRSNPVSYSVFVNDVYYTSVAHAGGGEVSVNISGLNPGEVNHVMVRQILAGQESQAQSISGGNMMQWYHGGGWNYSFSNIRTPMDEGGTMSIIRQHRIDLDAMATRLYTVTVDDVTYTTATVNWTEADGSTGATGYRVILNDTQVSGDLAAAVQTFDLTGMTAGSTNIVRIYANVPGDGWVRVGSHTFNTLASPIPPLTVANTELTIDPWPADTNAAGNIGSLAGVSGGVGDRTFEITNRAVSGDSLPESVTINNDGVLSGAVGGLNVGGVFAVTIRDSATPTPAAVTINVTWSVTAEPIARFTALNVSDTGVVTIDGINTTTDETISGQVILAIFDQNNRMISAHTSDILDETTILPGTVAFTGRVVTLNPAPILPLTGELRAFLWNTVDGMTPILPRVTVTIGE